MGFDLTWLFIVIAIVIVWSLILGAWWQANRRHGTRDMRQQRNAAIRDRDEARRQVFELSQTLAASVGHPVGLPRPGTGAAGAAHAPAGGPAAEAHLRLVRDGHR